MPYPSIDLRSLLLVLAPTAAGCSGAEVVIDAAAEDRADAGIDGAHDAPVDGATPSDAALDPTLDAAMGRPMDGAMHADDGLLVDAGNRWPTITSTPPARLVIELAPEPDFRTIELTPADVGSGSRNTFSTLPSDDPALFGFTGSDVRSVDFDVRLDGTAIEHESVLSDDYASIGITMENIRVSSFVFGGPASAPNATTSPFSAGDTQRFLFDVPVVAVGVINTSPDQDRFEFYDVEGELIYTTRDQDGAPVPDYGVDRFVGARTNNDRLIYEMRLVNASGQMELDELIFEVSTALLVRVDLGYTVTATDEDGDVLTYTLVSGPEGATIDRASGAIDWRPSNLDAGDHTFVVRVEDGRGGADEQTFTVTVVVTRPTP